MEIFDIALTSSTALLLLSTYGITFVSKGKPIFLVMVCIFLGVHLNFEGWRWQLVPIYTLALLLLGWSMHLRLRNVPSFIASQQGIVKPSASKLLRILSFAVCSVMLVLSLVSSYFLPMFVLPAPSGAHLVGTTDLHFIDQSRSETETIDPSDIRELMVTAWYPAELESESLAPYWPNAELYSRYFLDFAGPFSFFLSHLGNIDSNAYQDARVAESDGAFPVLIFSHGKGLFSRQSTVLMEELASHGYVVFSIDHSYWNMLSVFPDGRLVSSNQIDVEVDIESDSPLVERLYKQLTDSRDVEEKKRLIEEMIKIAPKTMQVERHSLDVWSQDQRYILDELASWSSEGIDNRFKNKLALDRVGVFGFSLGGKATIETCSIDHRCSAGINLDGFSLLSPGAAPQTSPFLTMANMGNTMSDIIHFDAEGPSHFVLVPETEHMNFMDASMYTRLFKDIGMVGAVDSDRMQNLTKDYVLAFFDRYLKPSSTQSLQALSSRYTELELLSRNVEAYDDAANQ